MEFILMRHAESQHNVAKRQIKSKHTEGPVKNSPQYKAIRVNPLFRDQLLSQEGIKQLEAMASQVNWDQVGLVLVSPMKRCLETCKKMLQKSNKQIEVIAEPLLKGRLSNVWGHGSSLQDLKISYPLYNFDNLNESFQTPWYVKTLSLNKQQQYLSLKDREQSLYQNLKEDYCQFKTRIAKVKTALDGYRSKVKGREKILIISHSCVLRTLTANKFDAKGKGISQNKFQHVQPGTFKDTELFKWTQNSEQKQENVQANEKN